MRKVNIESPEFTYDSDDPEGFRSDKLLVKRSSGVGYFEGEV